MAEFNEPTRILLEEVAASVSDVFKLADLVARAYENGNPDLIGYVADKFVVTVTHISRDEFERLIDYLLRSRETDDNYEYSFHWARIGHHFVLGRSDENSKIIAESVIRLIEEKPDATNLGQPFCYDVLDQDYVRIEAQWNRTLANMEKDCPSTLRNAADFFRDRNPEFAASLDDRARQAWDVSEGSGLVDE